MNSTPELIPPKRQEDLLFVSPCQLVIGQKLFPSLTLGLGTDLHCLLGDVVFLRLKANFQRKERFVSCYQPTLTVADGWVHWLNKWVLSGPV